MFRQLALLKKSKWHYYMSGQPRNYRAVPRTVAYALSLPVSLLSECLQFHRRLMTRRNLEWLSCGIPMHVFPCNLKCDFAVPCSTQHLLKECKILTSGSCFFFQDFQDVYGILVRCYSHVQMKELWKGMLGIGGLEVPTGPTLISAHLANILHTFYVCANSIANEQGERKAAGVCALDSHMRSVNVRKGQ